ncbi:MAG: hypothetical protein ACYC1D_17225 [Acidimicrobiales bacterium]
MAVREDCRHYVQRTVASGDVVRRCRLSANTEDPFACPEGCVFFEDRRVSAAGWAQAPSQPMSNTADGLLDLPAPSKRKRPRKRG